jgi:hypothetical protein
MDQPVDYGGFTWIGSVQGAVVTWSNHGVKKSLGYRLLITDQVATAPYTDPIQKRLHKTKGCQLPDNPWLRFFSKRDHAY